MKKGNRKKGTGKMKTSSLIRHSSLLLSPICFFVLAAGCNLFRPRPEAQEAKVPHVPVGDTSSLTTETLVAYLNSQADHLKSLEADDISILAKSQGNSAPTLEGSLMVQKPRYFKMTGRYLGSQQVLVGSNEERFWFYIPRMQDALIYCSYTDFEKGVELPFPFDPEWVLEAMGMSPVPANGVKRIEMDEKKTTVRLIQEGTLHGQKVTKVTVCYVAPMSRDVPQVKARIVYDERGKVICQATTKSVTRMPVGRNGKGETVYATAPQVVKLEWPAQDTMLELDLGKVKLNRQLPLDTFQMPRLGNRQVDLGRDRPTGRGGVVPAQFR
jgi:outer membrane lipoprotein-sorting protein